MLNAQLSSTLAGNRNSQFPISQSFPLAVVGSTKFGRYPKISNEATWNMIVSDGALVNFYGYEQVVVLEENGQTRELYNSPQFNHLIAVVGNMVYSIDSTFTVLPIGKLQTYQGPVFITENQGHQIAIVDGLNVYIYDYQGDNFQTITVDFTPVYITYQDTYFIAADGATNQWRLSAQNDGTSWPQAVDSGATNVGQYTTKPGVTIATVAFNRQLIVMGQTGAESWTDVGNYYFPYQLNNSWSSDYGCISTETIAVDKDLMVWLGTNEKSGLAILASDGGVPQQIEFEGLEFLFSQLTAPSDCYGFMFKLDGHRYYQFTFPTDNYSFVYDFNVKEFYRVSDENQNYHIAKRIAFFNNAYYFVSFKDSAIYQMGSQFTNYNYGTAANPYIEVIPRIRITPNIRFPNLDRFTIQNLVITMESGVNPPGIVPENISGPFNPPLVNNTAVELSVSKDGGYTYGNSIVKYTNPYGQRANIFQFWNVGRAGNDTVIKLIFWSPGRFVVTNGEMKIYV